MSSPFDTIKKEFGDSYKNLYNFFNIKMTDSTITLNRIYFDKTSISSIVISKKRAYFKVLGDGVLMNYVDDETPNLQRADDMDVVYMLAALCENLTSDEAKSEG